MGYTIGIDLGTTFTAAALLRDGRAEVVALGNHAATIPSMVFLREDDNVLIGDAAERRGMQEPARLAREFKRRLGDSVPILLDRTPYSAERLMAVMLRQIVADVTARQGGAPDRIAVSHPANWGQFKIDLLRQAVELAGLGAATFVTEPEAAAVQYASTERVEVGDVIAVYDLGGGTFDAAVLRKTATGFTTLGRPQGIERLGGIDFDEAVVAHVRRTVGDLIADLDVNDPATRAALARMRHECVLAKESLSSDSDATVPVMLPNVQTQVRITRSEFEDMIRPRLRDTIDSTRRAVESAGVQLADVKAVLLCGGSSRIPLVSEMVRAELGRPVVTDSHPKHAVALGAARMARAVAASPFVPPAPPSTTAAAAAAAVAAVSVVSAATPSPAHPPTEPVAVSARPLVTGSQPVTPPSPATEALSTSPPPPAGASTGRGNSQWKLLAGGIAAVGLLIGVLVVAFGGGSDTSTGETVATTGATVATTLAGTVAPVTDPPPETVVTDPATTAAGGTLGTAVTIAPEQRTCNETTNWCVGIISASWFTDGVFRVNYETQNFVPTNSGVAGDYHVHFFWSSIAPDMVGAPGSGPWYVWDLNDGGGEYMFDAFTIDNFESYGYQWGDNICVGIADHQHAIAGDLTAAGIGTYYCLPDTPTPSAG